MKCNYCCPFSGLYNLSIKLEAFSSVYESTCFDVWSLPKGLCCRFGVFEARRSRGLLPHLCWWTYISFLISEWSVSVPWLPYPDSPSPCSSTHQILTTIYLSLPCSYSKFLSRLTLLFWTHWWVYSSPVLLPEWFLLVVHWSFWDAGFLRWS